MSTVKDSIRIKRGMSAELPESLPLGELAFCIDTRELWVGSGDGLPLKRVTNTEITQHLEEWNLLYTEVNERFETKYHDVSSQFAEKFLDLSEQFSDKYQDLNKQFSDKFEEICVQFSTKYDKLEEHYAKDLLANKLLSQSNKESIDLLKRDIGTTENIEDLREINNQATETLEQLNAVKEELQNDVLVIKDIEKDLQKASVDYSGEHHENLKDSMDANVDFILGEFNSTNMTGEHITAHNTIQRHIKNAELKGHTEVNYIKDPSDKDLVMPYPFDDAQSIKLSDTKDTGSLNIVLKGNTEVNVLKNPMRDYVVPYEFEEGYTATLTDTKETGSIQSAILKGQTLINHFHLSGWGEQEKITLVSDGTAKRVNLGYPKTIKTNTKYLTIIPIYENTINHNLTIGGWNYYSSQPLITKNDGTGIIKKIATTVEDGSRFHGGIYLELWRENTSGQITFGKPMLIEYQEGMKNWDIPYFEGMQSVKMPVLQTVGKNLFDGKLELGGINHNTGALATSKTAKRNVDYITVKPNTQLSFSVNSGESGINWFFYDVNENYISNTFARTVTSPPNAHYLRFYNLVGDIPLNDYQIMIAESTAPVTYEPYKSNILSTPEDLELRGIGEVRDTLDCLTGEVTERTGFLKSTDIPNNSWYGYTEYDNGIARITYMLKGATKDPSNSNMICDKYLVASNANNTLTTSNISLGDTANPVLHLRVPYNLLSSRTLQGFIEYVEQNPFNITYQLATESIKTVDFTIKNQNNQPVSKLSTYNEVTNIITSSKDGSLLPTVVSTLPEFPVLIKPNTKYSVINYGSANNHEDTPLSLNLGGSKVDTTIDNKLTVIRTPETLQNEVFKINGEGLKLSCVIVEGDMTGKELPDYFEGMKSVKNPVVTTNGRNLFDNSRVNTRLGQFLDTGYVRVECNGATGDIFNKQKAKGLIKPNTKYTITIDILENTLAGMFEAQYSGDSRSSLNCSFYINSKFVGKQSKIVTSHNVITDNHWVLIPKVISQNTNGHIIFRIIIEEGTNEDSVFTPYQSTTLTISEDITLRGIDNIKDELDVTTGKLTRRIGEVVFDGSERTTLKENLGDVNRFFIAKEAPNVYWTNNQISNQYVYNGTDFKGNYEHFYVDGDGNLMLFTKDSSVTEVQERLKENNLVIQYECVTPIIKTVDFTIKNQNNKPVSKLSTYNEVTHIDTSVEEVIKPTISHRDLEYSVLIKPNTKYSIITNPMKNDHNINPISFDLGGTKVSQSLENHCTVITTPQTLTHEKLIFSEGVGHKLQGGVMVLEGDKTGMMFSHFDGMKSVENPTVRVNNKNLFNGDWEYAYLQGGEQKVFREVQKIPGKKTRGFLLKLKPNTTYVISREYITNRYAIGGFTSKPKDGDEYYPYPIDNNQFTTDSIRTYVYFYLSNESEEPMVQVEESSVATTIIPHQSNSLPLTIPMRSLPNGVCDTLNLLTGEYVQNVYEHVFTGEENFSSQTWGNQYRHSMALSDNGLPRSIFTNTGYCNMFIMGDTNKDQNAVRISIEPNSIRLACPYANSVELKEFLRTNEVIIQYAVAEPIITYLDLQWEDGKLFAYDGTTHFFVDVEGGHLQPILDVDVPVNIVAELSRLRAEKEQLETSKAQLENQLEVITYRNTNLQSNLDSLVAENQDLKLQTYDLQTRSNVLQLKNKEMTKHQEKLQAENLELQKRASELAQTTMNLTEELHVVDSVRETGDLELLSSDFELDFRLMEIEFALDIPMTFSAKGVNGMARTPYEMAKTLILGGKYEREDMETKLKLYRDRGKLTVAEYEELIALMDANELA